MKWLLWIGGGIATLIIVMVILGSLLPKRHTVTRRTRIAHPPQKVWEAIANPAGAAAWRPDVKQVEMLEPRNGRLVWREHWKDGNKILFEQEEAAAPSRLVTRIADPSLPFGGRWIHELKVVENGTEIAITEDGEIYNPIFRFLARFVFGHSGTIEAYLKALEARKWD